MSPLLQKRSLADLQLVDVAATSITSPPAECNDGEYERDVLQFEEGQTEAGLDDQLSQQAEKLGIIISRPQTPAHDAPTSRCESPITVASPRHARTASTWSQDSASTGMTSNSSNEQDGTLASQQIRRRSSTRRSLSVSEYEKLLTQAGPQQDGFNANLPRIPAEPAPSLFSVSTRRSYQSIRNGFKNRLRLRRGRSASTENLK
jgi:hypothetical protein